jgi:hypothetical protein
MPQFAFVTAYGPESLDTPTLIPMRLTVRYLDTDQNTLAEFQVTYTVATNSTANQIMAAGVTAIKNFGATHGFADLGANSIIGPTIIRGG